MGWHILDTAERVPPYGNAAEDDLGVLWCVSLSDALSKAAVRAGHVGRPQEVYLALSYGHAKLVAIQVPQG